MVRKLIDFLKSLEWSWSLIGQIGGVAVGFALPAWAVEAANLFAQYSPFSWVVAGFSGAALVVLGYVLFALARHLHMRFRIDSSAVARGTYVNPLSPVFDHKRIYLHDFVLPSYPVIEGKTFINCEIIGPANIFLQTNNAINEIVLPKCDAVYLPTSEFFNGFVFRNCLFRGCSFQRVTMFWSDADFPGVKAHPILNWISLTPDSAAAPRLPPPQKPTAVQAPSRTS